MIDLCCIILLYLTFLLHALGLEMVFLFEAIVVVCVTKLCITFIKRILKAPSQAEDAPNFLTRYMDIVVRFGASMACLLFTALAGSAIKIVFIIWMVIVVLLGVLIKQDSVKCHGMVLSAVGYGFVLAKWYFLHPLDGRFGNRGIEECLAILLSAVVLMIPIVHMIHSRKPSVAQNNP